MLCLRWGFSSLERLFWSDKQSGVGGIAEEQPPRARPREVRKQL